MTLTRTRTACRRVKRKSSAPETRRGDPLRLGRSRSVPNRHARLGVSGGAPTAGGRFCWQRQQIAEVAVAGELVGSVWALMQDCPGDIEAGRTAA